MEISLEWFKKSKRKEVKKMLKIAEEQTPSHHIWQGTTTADYIKPYKSVKLINDVLIVLTYDGIIISKSNATEEDFKAVQSAQNMNEILNVIATKEVNEARELREKEIEKARNIKNGLATLGMFSDFTVEDDSVYLNGTSRTIPQLLLEEFIEIIESYSEYTVQQTEELLLENDKYQALKRFFLWCCLNPRAEVSNELYRFLKDNSFRITKQGFFVALRNVVTVHGGVELVDFISNTYNKIKAVWKKNPDKYTVFLQNDVYKLVHEDDLYKSQTVTCDGCEGTGDMFDEIEGGYYCCNDCDGEGKYTEEVLVNHGTRVGTLTELYLDLPNRKENRFTDAWTNTFDIRIGQVVNMPMNECNWSTRDCAAAGLHFTSDEIHYVGCGDTSVLVIINPMKVVGIGAKKGRCYEYLPIMTVAREEATSILHDGDFDTLELDEAYAVHELEDLSEKVKEGFIAEASKYQFNIPGISSTEIDNIILSLEEMKNELSSRIQLI